MGNRVFGSAIILKCVCYFIALMLVCASYFLDGDFMLEPCDKVYDGGYEETNVTNDIVHMQ